MLRPYRGQFTLFGVLVVGLSSFAFGSVSPSSSEINTNLNQLNDHTLTRSIALLSPAPAADFCESAKQDAIDDCSSIGEVVGAFKCSGSGATWVCIAPPNTGGGDGGGTPVLPRATVIPKHSIQLH